MLQASKARMSIGTPAPASAARSPGIVIAWSPELSSREK